MTLALSKVASDFALAFKAVDATRPQGASRNRTYRPGVGPLTEPDAIGRAVRLLGEEMPGSSYESASHGSIRLAAGNATS